MFFTADTIFQATAQLMQKLTVSCTARNFTVILDEPPVLGGDDNGMNPVEALLSSLGACKCIVAGAFAKMHKINLKSIKIDLEGVLDPDGFLGKNPKAKMGFSKIITRFHICADNTPEEIKQFVKFIESHCPVHDTLANAPAFETHISFV